MPRSSGDWRTPEWDTSRSSAASTDRTASTNRRPLSFVARLVGSCFAPSDAKPATAAYSEDYSSRTRSPSMSGSSYMYGSSVASGKRRSGNGLFSPVQMKLLSQSKSVYDGNLGTEFQSEVQVLARIEHLNLVRSLGYLVHEEERLVIVEYVPNRTLRENLDGLRGSQLDLASRLDITIDVAHAITYLHMYIVTPNNKTKNKDFKSWLSPNKSYKIVMRTLLFVVVCGFSFYLGGIYGSEKSSYSTKNVGSTIHSRKETGASPLQIKPLAFVEGSIDYQDYTPCTNPKVE